MRKTVTGLAAVLVGALLLPSEGVAQVEITSRALKINLTGRFQLQGRTSSCSSFPLADDSACGEQVPGFDLFARRARFAIVITYNNWIEGKIQPDFSDLDGVELKDAYGRLKFGPGARLTAGHFKRPFDGFQLTSSTQFLTIERDIDIPGVSGLTAASLDEFTTRFRLSDRDIGVMLDGDLGDSPFHYWIGTFNGGDADDNNDENTEMQFMGRLALELDVGDLPLELAVAGALAERAYTTAAGALEAEYFTAFELWGELGGFNDGPHVQAGFILGENPLQNALGEEPDFETDDLASFRTWQVIGSWKLPVEGVKWVSAVEPVFRVTMAEPNTDVDDDTAWGITPGVQVFFDGRNKVALNWDIASFEDDSLRSENSFKLMYFFHF